MFITIDRIAQLVSDSGGQALIAGGIGHRSTALEAAECVSRAVYLGHGNMNEVNDAFKKEYGRPELPELVQAV